MNFRTNHYQLFGMFLIALTSFTLVLIWFQEGMIMGGGDVGIPFYNPTSTLNLVRYTWWQSGSGLTSTNTISSIPFYAALSALSHIGISDVSIQALVYFLVLLIGTSSVYFMTSKLLGSNRIARLASILAALFYMLNPFSLVLVWHRFAPTSILFSALLPLALLLTVRGLKSKKILLPTLSITLVITAFSYCFGSPALLFTLWIVLLSYLLFYVIYSKGRVFVQVAKFTALLVALFILTNLWWIAPYLYEYSNPTMMAVRGFAGSGGQPLGAYNVIDVSRLFSRFYLVVAPMADLPYEHGHFGLVYTTPLFQLISVMIPIIAFATFLFKRKEQSVLYFTVLSVLGIFLAKGSAPPLGEPLQWLVGNFLICGPLRTAFDKLGFIVALGYSYLFGVGIASLYAWVRGRHGTRVRPPIRRVSRRVIAMALIGVLCFSFFGLYQWPMWTGDVFRRGDGIPDMRLKVPSYYSEANEWLSTQPYGRIIAMPFGGILTYTWPPYGYHGIECTEAFFNRRVIGKWIELDYLDQVIYAWRKFYNTNAMWKFMNLFGARFVMIRHDIEYPDSSTSMVDNPYDIEFAMRNLISTTFSGEKIAPYTPSPITVPCEEKQIYYGNSTEGFTAYAVSNPSFEVEQTGGINGTFCIVLRGDPVNRNFGAFYEIDIGKGNWTNFSMMEIWIKASQPGSLFVEVHDSKGTIGSWDGRSDSTYAITPSQVDSWRSFLFPLPEEGVTNVTRLLILLLNMPSNQTTYLKVGGIKVSTVPRQVLSEKGTWNIVWGLDRTFSSSENETAIYKVKPEGDERAFAISYEIPLSLRNLSKFTALRIYLNVTSSGNLLFGATDSKNQGVNWDGRYDEYYQITENDVSKWKGVLLDLESKRSSIDLSNVTSLLIGMTRAVSPYVELHIQDISGITKENRLVPNPHISYVKSIGELDFYEIDSSYFLDTVYATNRVTFSGNAYTMLEMMDEPSFIPGDTLVFLESQRDMSDPAFLKSLNADAPLYKPAISFLQIDPTHYEVSVVNATQPFFLFFGETYHPLWTATIQGAGEIPDNRHSIMNGYANAWYIDKTGTYKIDITFSLQTIFNYSAIASSLTLIVCFLYLVGSRFKSHLKRLYGKIGSIRRH